MKRKKAHNKLQFSHSIFLMIAGLVLGTVFTFGMKFWSKPVKRSECISVKTEFLSYKENRKRGRIQTISINCSDGERYFIDSVSVNKTLINDLSEIKSGENIILLIHPNSNTILEFKASGKVILNFTETRSSLKNESIAFNFLGIFMYICAAVGMYYTALHLYKKHKRPSH